MRNVKYYETMEEMKRNMVNFQFREVSQNEYGYIIKIEVWIIMNIYPVKYKVNPVKSMSLCHQLRLILFNRVNFTG